MAVLAECLEVVMVWMKKTGFFQPYQDGTALGFLPPPTPSPKDISTLDRMALPQNELLHNLDAFLDSQLLPKEQVTALALRDHI